MSVGSLYQYFPDKLSLVDAIRQNHLDEAPSSDDYRNPNSGFEIEYLAYYADAVSIYRNRQPNKADYITALIISDAVDGVIHNAARRGLLEDPGIQSELIRLLSKYLDEGGNPE